MKQWFRMAAFACLVGSAGFVAAQTPAGAGRQGGTGAGTAGKGQEPTSTAKPAPGSPAQGTPAAADAMFIRTAATDGMAEVERRASERGLGAVRWPQPWPNDGLAAMRANTDRALELGVFGVPTVVRDGEVVWGDDRL